ncbi:hypothetical protein BC628DRAFT_1382473 [Trametes gibbosa]|nr:hypothetical protein BC628DRAFT_1382473 [Trametes gibbosa]
MASGTRSDHVRWVDAGSEGGWPLQPVQRRVPSAHRHRQPLRVGGSAPDRCTRALPSLGPPPACRFPPSLLGGARVFRAAVLPNILQWPHQLASRAKTTAAKPCCTDSRAHRRPSLPSVS